MSSVLGCNTSTSDPVSLLKAINEKLSKVLSGRSFDNDRLNVTVQPEKIDLLKQVSSSFRSEYKGRKEMVLKRLDATRQTFSWSDALRDDTLPKINFFVEKTMTTNNCCVPARFGLLDILIADKSLLVQVPVSRAVIANAKDDVIRNYVIDPSTRIPDKGGRTKLTPTASALPPKTVTTSTKSATSTTNLAPSQPQKQVAPKQQNRQQQGQNKPKQQRTQGTDTQTQQQGGKKPKVQNARW